MEKQHKKLLVLSLFFCVIFSLFLFLPRKDLPDKTTTKETISSDSFVAANTQFAQLFSGEWKSEEDAKLVEFRQKNDLVVLEINSDNDYEKNSTIEVKVSEHLSSYNRWLLTPIKTAEYQYNVQQLSEDKISLYRSSTQANTEGTAKPINYYRVKQ